MKIITVTCTSKPECRKEVMDLCLEMIDPSRAEEGCLTYKFFSDATDDLTFFFYEEWKDQAAIDVHVKTQHYQLFQKKFNSLLTEDAVITIHTVDQ